MLLIEVMHDIVVRGILARKFRVQSSMRRRYDASGFPGILDSHEERIATEDGQVAQTKPADNHERYTFEDRSSDDSADATDGATRVI